MKKLVGIVTVLSSLLFTSAASAYTVQPGDTMWKISQSQKVTYTDLLKANPQIINPAMIYVGQNVNVPKAPWEIKADAIIKTGESYIGKTQYQYGAPRYYMDNFRDDRFDCSSFQQYIYYLNGIKLDSNSHAQAANNGFKVSLGDIRKGDLIFFRSYYSDKSSTTITHVAMYVGDNKLLHTYGSPGVVYTNFRGTSWENRVITVKRVIN
ncbi:MAG TPA: NlpC/P60 family protein [Pseudoneobacillus sp.]|nr:NlpC/P60 family protein [Pseudoneobacillus sp.]